MQMYLASSSRPPHRLSCTPHKTRSPSAFHPPASAPSFPPSPCTSLPARRSSPSASSSHSCLPALSCPLSPFLPPCPRIYPPPSPRQAAAPMQNSRRNKKPPPQKQTEAVCTWMKIPLEN